MNDFKIIIPLTKSNSGRLNGIASTTSVDKDEERMSETALNMMVNDIKQQGVNLFGNHSHEWENTLGVINNANLIDKQVHVDITLDDPNTNPKIPMLLNKLNKGIKLGLSVGGNVESYKWEYSKEAGKKVKVLDKIKIYEVSVVGIPSNSDSFITIPSAIAKSAKLPGLRKSICPVCLGSMQSDTCAVCFWKM
jgi:HK97 family phage prohead protease